MPTDKQQARKTKLRELLAELSPSDLDALLRQEQQTALHEAETAKLHPLVGFTLPPATFDAICLHLMDGGGVTQDMMPTLNDKSLTVILWQAIADRDQETFWRELPHLVKSWVAQRGLVRRVEGGGLAIVGLGSQVAPALMDGKDESSAGA